MAPRSIHNSVVEATLLKSTSLSDRAVDCQALSNELSQSSQLIRRHNKFYVSLTKLTLLGSLSCLALSARLYYVLYHAPLRHAWRIKEAHRRVPQYRRLFIGMGILGVGGIMFLVSPAGFPQLIERRYRYADEIDGLAMRCLFLRQQFQRVYEIGARNNFFEDSPHVHNAVLEGEGNDVKNLGLSCNCHLPLVVQIPRWSMSYCFASSSSAEKTSRWRMLKKTILSSLPPQTVLLHPSAEKIACEWIWAPQYSHWANIFVGRSPQYRLVERLQDDDEKKLGNPHFIFDGERKDKRILLPPPQANLKLEWEQSVRMLDNMMSEFITEPLDAMRSGNSFRLME